GTAMSMPARSSPAVTVTTSASFRSTVFGKYVVRVSGSKTRAPRSSTRDADVVLVVMTATRYAPGDSDAMFAGIVCRHGGNWRRARVGVGLHAVDDHARVNDRFPCAEHAAGDDGG